MPAVLYEIGVIIYVCSNTFQMEHHVNPIIKHKNTYKLVKMNNPSFILQCKENFDVLTYKGGSNDNSLLPEAGAVNPFGIFITLQ